MEEEIKRTDYILDLKEARNGDRCPVEVYELGEALRKWQFESAVKSREIFD
jgi:hypothetical protein